MSRGDRLVQSIAEAIGWNTRVALIRRIPEEFGRAQWREVYSAIAQSVYVPHLTPDFAYLHWREDYNLATVEEALRGARDATNEFTQVSPHDLARALGEHPKSLRCFRLILAFTPRELAAATIPVAATLGLPPVTEARIKSMEAGRSQPAAVGEVLAAAIHRGVGRDLFPPASEGLISKQQRPDLANGWDTVRHLVRDGVPYSMFLHQRHYGGAFRQVLDATSELRGNILEDAVEEIFVDAGLGNNYIRTGSHDQAEIAHRFHLTVQPAPDFVVFDGSGNLRALLECKSANDGGTARDKASRFGRLRAASQTHGGIPVFAVLGGLGWLRTSDALGPVVQECDGRVFTLGTLREILTVDPFPALLP